MSTLSLIVIAKHSALTYQSLVDIALEAVEEVVTIVDVNPELGILGYRKDKIKYFEHPLDMHFANQRNFGIEKATEDYCLHLDTDEQLGLWMWNNIHDFCRGDLIMLPRANYTDGEGPVNFPDWQPKLHAAHLRWQYPVHEWPIGFDQRYFLPAELRYSIRHYHTQKRELEAEDFYKRIRECNLLSE